MLQKPLPVFNGELIWFILTNGNHPMSNVSRHSVLLGQKLNQNQPFYQFRNLLHQDRSLETRKSPFSLLLRYLISLCFCFRLSEAFNSTNQEGENSNLYLGYSRKPLRPLRRKWKVFQTHFQTDEKNRILFYTIYIEIKIFSFNTYERVTTSLIWTTTLSVQTIQSLFLQWTILSWTTEFPIWLKRGKRCTVRISPKLLLDWWKTLHLSSNRSKDITRIFEPNKNKEIQS